MDDFSFVDVNYGPTVVRITSPSNLDDPLYILGVRDDVLPDRLQNRISLHADGLGGVLSFDGESRAAVIGLLRHLYLGDYLQDPKLQDRPISMLLHVQIYKLASTIGIESLTRQAYAYAMRETELACSTPPMVLDLCDAIRFLYLELPDAEPLFDLITNYVVGCYMYHGLGSDPAFLQTVYEAPDFHQRLLATSLARGFDADGAMEIINTPFCGHRAHEDPDPMIRNSARFMCHLHQDISAAVYAGDKRSSSENAPALRPGRRAFGAMRDTSVWREPSMSQFSFYPHRNVHNEAASETLARMLQEEADRRFAEEEEENQPQPLRLTLRTRDSINRNAPRAPNDWAHNDSENGFRDTVNGPWDRDRGSRSAFDVPAQPTLSHEALFNYWDESGANGSNGDDLETEMQRTPRAMYSQSTTNLNWPLVDDALAAPAHAPQPRPLAVTNFTEADEPATAATGCAEERTMTIRGTDQEPSAWEDYYPARYADAGAQTSPRDTSSTARSDDLQRENSSVLSESPTLYNVSGTATPETVDGFEMLTPVPTTRSAGDSPHEENDEEDMFPMEDLISDRLRHEHMSTSRATSSTAGADGEDDEAEWFVLS